MPELRAYALAVAELRAVAGSSGAERERLWLLAQEAFAPRRPLQVREVLGPIYRRVPGAPVLRESDPTPADLDALLAGSQVPPARAPAVWRLVEALAAGLSWGSTRVPSVVLPPALLAPTGLSVPAVPGLTVGWCTPRLAETVPGLRDWLPVLDGWSAAARSEGRPDPDVIGFLGRATT